MFIKQEIPVLVFNIFIMEIQIPYSKQKRVVIVGGGFGGVALANRLDSKMFQIVLIDKCNYHQFPPLLYQVACSGLEAGSISFPFRNVFSRKKNFYFRLAELTAVDMEKNRIETTIGGLSYDYLVIAAGTMTNYFGNEVIKAHSLPMKSLEEALELKNTLLLNLERSLDMTDPVDKQSLLNIVVVGGGPTGVEVAGALAEMKRYVLRKDYPNLTDMNMNIYLVEGSPKVLGALSEESSANALRFLEKMGVNVVLNKRVVGYEDHQVLLDSGEAIRTETLIWVSGVTSVKIGNLPGKFVGRAGRLLVNEFNQLDGVPNVFAIGDIALQQEKGYPNGHPQLAPVAIQQGRLLADNLRRKERGESLKCFHYNNQGSLATVGRNKAVADLKMVKLHGFAAWAVWMLVHLRSILGVRNKILTLTDWVWSYFTYGQSVRHIIFAKPRET